MKNKKKVYEVVLTCTTKQRKYIAADSPEEAEEIAGRDDMEWNEKEEVQDSETSVCSGDAYAGKYIEFVDDDGNLESERFDPKKHVNGEV